MNIKMKTPLSGLSLVADVGGTNTRLALAEGVTLRANTIRRYANASYDDLATILRDYLAQETPGALSGACVAMAGPVHDGKGMMTNLKWQFDTSELAEVTGAPNLAVINDLQAQGFALPHLGPEFLGTVLAGPAPATKATKLVVGLGTGMNIAPVFYDDASQIVPPAECGHISLPQHSSSLRALAESLVETHGFASVEEALSGRGLENIDRHLHNQNRTGREVISKAEDGDAGAIETLRLYSEILGTVMGDLALIHLPFGGLYLVGGMARATAPWLGKLGFASAFRAKGRFGPFMDKFAVSLVTDDYAALIGCAANLTKMQNLSVR